MSKIKPLDIVIVSGIFVLAGIVCLWYFIASILGYIDNEGHYYSVLLSTAILSIAFVASGILFYMQAGRVREYGEEYTDTRTGVMSVVTGSLAKVPAKILKKNDSSTQEKEEEHEKKGQYGR